MRRRAQPTVHRDAAEADDEAADDGAADDGADAWGGGSRGALFFTAYRRRHEKEMHGGTAQLRNKDATRTETTNAQQIKHELREQIQERI